MRKLIILNILLYIGLCALAQGNKKALTFDDILKWNRITEKMISNDGNIIVYKSEPWKGDPVLKIANKSGKELTTVNCGAKAAITNNSDFVVFSIKPQEEEIRLLKLKKTKKEDMPLDNLGIYNIESNNLVKIERLKSYKVPEKWGGWIAFLTKSKIIKDTSITDSLKEKKSKIKKESKENGFQLTVMNADSNEKLQFPFVTDYIFAEDKEVLAFISTGNDKDFKPGVYSYDLNSSTQSELLTGKGEYKQLSLNKAGSAVAFIADTTGNKKNSYSLYYWMNDGFAKEILNNCNSNIPAGYEISLNGRISFSEKTNRIFFGTAPLKPEKDTTVLEEEIPLLDVWHWNEPVLYTEQINTKKYDLKKTYLAVYHLDDKKMIQLENEKHTGIELINKGDNNKVLAWSNLPYSVQTMWEGTPVYNNLCLIDINTGESSTLKNGIRATPVVSPEGKYLYWYNAVDTSWNTYKISTGEVFKVTSPDIVQCADELNDIPNLPHQYGTAGWLEDDEALLVYDRYDIWKIDPENKIDPKNITKNGRQYKINYRYINFDQNRSGRRNYEEKGIDINKPFYLRGHKEVSRVDGYYKLDFAGNGSPEELISGEFSLNRPLKARDADVFIYTRETFTEFPDLLISANEFKKSKKISNVNPQQKNFKWGTKELYSWTSLDGRKLEGLLIKPENFDPNKKYPMIVNFYEKSSHELYEHQIPEAHRSTVDYHYYSSNGYVVFNPDVYYKEGYPGEDAFNCVMPGVTQLISEGFIDKNSIAAQGHSWGGYQVAYLATRTNLFAAIESGAPVVNMFSAYGGIRLWSGRNRSFQYEHTQSRIGKSIWESPLRYLENSPLFTADKIQTPMLIMHNENDGAVPFSQGVEFFIALRRLGKQVWLLNYNEADHWPTKVRDKYDFQIRLAQFFDHYLKGEPMPVWMKEGIPAVSKGFEMGYELME
ncbi:MAG: prolyl oligopeptidase family serine peptidase [Bacteroidales bacterium]|nr:prolyl oligopeptidase family serine peptidase [Bacteroidales bacterium]